MGGRGDTCADEPQSCSTSNAGARELHARLAVHRVRYRTAHTPSKLSTAQPRKTTAKLPQATAQLPLPLSSSTMAELAHNFRSFADLRARTNAGEDVSFDAFAGKVCLVVNVGRGADAFDGRVAAAPRLHVSPRSRSARRVAARARRRRGSRTAPVRARGVATPWLATLWLAHGWPSMRAGRPPVRRSGGPGAGGPGAEALGPATALLPVQPVLFRGTGLRGRDRGVLLRAPRPAPGVAHGAE